MIQWGDKEAFLELKEEQTGITPPALKNKPSPDFLVRDIIRAFNLFQTKRIINQSLQPIQLTEIVAYLTLYPFYDTDLFVRLITKVDKYYIEQREKDNEKVKNE
jgi:hypothetical protein